MEKIKIKEIIVVEGKDDISAVKSAVDANLIATNGYGFPKGVEEKILKAASKVGVIVLTDSDYAGERIRQRVNSLLKGKCKNAFIPRDESTKDGDIGVENAKPQSIIKALEKARFQVKKTKDVFTIKDMIYYGLQWEDNSSYLRLKVGSILGIGYGNAKTFLGRLNNYGITKQELEEALNEIYK